MLEPLRSTPYDGPERAAGDPPYWEPGQIITWHYGDWADVLRVVRDDPRGLVAWLPADSQRVVAVPVDGRGLRDRPVAERSDVERVLQVAAWRGPGIVKIAPTGVPWSVWYFTDGAGTFEGHYVNLELVHERPTDGSPRVHSRDLILDLWLEARRDLAQGRRRAGRGRRSREVHLRAGWRSSARSPRTREPG